MTSPARLNELNYAENPAREFLERLGYEYVPREVLAAEREGEREVLLRGRLTAALMRLNEWMTEDQAQRVIFNLQHVDATGLARNQAIHTYLAYGMPLTIDLEGRQETPTVRFFDFDHPEPGTGLNEYVVTTQFRVRRGTDRGSAAASEDDEKVIKPDLVLFVNGIPLVVMEAKSPTLLEVWKTKAVKQLRRYQEAGPEWHGAGAPELFDTNLMCVAHCGADRGLRSPRRSRERLRGLEVHRAAHQRGVRASLRRARRGPGAAHRRPAQPVGAARHPARLHRLPAGTRAAREEAAALPAVPRRHERRRAHPRRPHAGGARRRGLAHPGLGQVADDALARDEAAALPGAAQPDGRRRHRPHAARRADLEDVPRRVRPRARAGRQHTEAPRAAAHEQRPHRDDDESRSSRRCWTRPRATSRTSTTPTTSS